MTPVTEAFSSALLHFIWQGVAGGVLLWFTLGVLKGRSANARYFACCVALFGMALAPMVTAWVVYDSDVWKSDAFFSPVRETFVPVSSIADAVSTSVAWGGYLARVENLILPIWAMGVVFFALRLAWAAAHASVLRRHGTGAEVEMVTLVSRLAKRLGVRRSVQVLRSTLAEVPSVVGWIRPVILLPSSVVTGLTPEQLEAIVVHELAHIRRHDYLVNILQTIVETLLFYHPAVWWVSSRIRHERELCCDDVAVADCGDTLRYARALAQLERLRLREPSLAMGSADGPLVYRIQRLVAGDRNPQPSSRLGTGVILVAVVVCLLVNLRGLQAGSEPAVVAPEAVGIQVVGGAAVPEESLQGGVSEQHAVALQTEGKETSVPEGELRQQPDQGILSAATSERSPSVLSAQLPPPAPASPPPSPPPAPPPPPPPPPPPASTLQRLAQTSSPWVLFRADAVIVNAGVEDEKAARSMRESIKGDYVWFRLDGNAYVTQDEETIARFAELAKSPGTTTRLDELNRDLQRLERSAEAARSNDEARRAQMEALQRQLEMIRAQMEATRNSLREFERAQRMQLDLLSEQRRLAERERAQTLDLLNGIVNGGKASPVP